MATNENTDKLVTSATEIAEQPLSPEKEVVSETEVTEQPLSPKKEVSPEPTPNETIPEQTAENLAPHVEVDQETAGSNDDNDSAYDSDQLSRYTDSLSSSVRDYKFDHGRRYHAYHSGVYNFPNDDAEQDRLDMFHHVVLLACEGKLHHAPIKTDDGARILDIGTGTGIWAMQMGDLYQSADITGNDLSPIQPNWVPPNVRFLIDDVESPWVESTPYDFIHSRYMAASILDWPTLIRQCFANLKPGGWVEFQDYDTTCRSQDGSIPRDYKVGEMVSLLRGALDRIGRIIDPGPLLRGWIEEAGFVGVREKIVPLPVGIWPQDRKMKEIGAFMMLQYTEGVEAFTLVPFMTILGWSKEEIDVMNIGVRNHARDKRIHTLHNFHIVWAQKPLEV